MSSDTGVLKMSPVNSHNVCLASIPEVPSNTCNRFLKFQKKVPNEHILLSKGIFCQKELLNTSVFAWSHFFLKFHTFTHFSLNI